MPALFKVNLLTFLCSQLDISKTFQYFCKQLWKHPLPLLKILKEEDCRYFQSDEYRIKKQPWLFALLCNDYFVLILPSLPGVSALIAASDKLRFVDFCGNTSTLMHYLYFARMLFPLRFCLSQLHIPEWIHSPEDEASVAAHRMQKVLLGWKGCRVVWNTKRLSRGG